MTKKQKEQLKSGISLVEFVKLIPNDDMLYRNKINPRYVYVKGKDLNLHATGEKGLITQTNNLFWNYHQAHYGFPTSQKDFISRISKSSIGSKIAVCRTTIWKSYQAALRKK